MKRFVEGEDRTQSVMFPERLDDYIAKDNPVRMIDLFVDKLKLGELGFSGIEPSATGRPAYHPSTLLKIYIYGYLNRIHSSRRLERETQRNVELMWLTGNLMPDFKTIADFRRNNGKGIKNVCRQFVVLCRHMEVFSDAIVAIDGSKFKAVNNRDKNFTANKIKRRLEKIAATIEVLTQEMERSTVIVAAQTDAFQNGMGTNGHKAEILPVRLTRTARKSLNSLVARGRIELPTRGFSVPTKSKQARDQQSPESILRVWLCRIPAPVPPGFRTVGHHAQADA